MSFEDDYMVDPGVERMAYGYDTAERVLGVPAEVVALAVSRQGSHLGVREAPGIEDVREVVSTALDIHVTPGVSPMGRMLDVLVD